MKPHRFTGALVTALILLGLSYSSMPSLIAQATTSQTTLSAAVTDLNATSIRVAAATNFAAGWGIVVDGEAMTIASTYTSGTTIPVIRGAQNTGKSLHASGAVVLAGPPNYFRKTIPSGPCTSTNEVALPAVVVGGVGGPPNSVSVLNCQGASSTTQRWQLYLTNGFPQIAGFTSNTPAGVAPPTYTGAGAITVMPGLQWIGSGGALSMTLADPALYQSGTVMIIQASTAQAHVVTYTAGFFGTTTSSDVATFAGAIGDGFAVIAQNGTWRCIWTRNVTIA